MVLAATACDDLVVYSEGREFGLTITGLRQPAAQPLSGWSPPHLLLAGSRLCVQSIDCLVCPEGEPPCSVEAVEFSGPVEADGDGCYVAVAPGEIVWTAPECSESDALRMRVVAPDEVEPVALHELDGYGRAGIDDIAPMVELLGAPLLGDVEWPLRLAAESSASLPLELRERASGMPVAFERDKPAVVWDTVRGRPPVTYPGAAVAPVVFAGGEYEASVRFGDHTWPLGQVLGVAPDAAESLEIAASLAYDEDPNAPLLGRTATPFLAHAIARDAEGHVVLGLPVRWTVDSGEIAAFEPPAPMLSEYLLLDDSCVPPEERGGQREVVLRATSGELSATLTLRWTGKAEPAEVGWRASPLCLPPTSEGCGCRTDAPGAGALLALGLLALRRRRKGVSKDMVAATCLLSLPLAACGEPDPPSVRAAESLELGRLHTPDGGGTGASAVVGDQVVWMFYRDNTSWVLDSPETSEPLWVASAAVSDDLDASDGLYPLSPVLAGGELLRPFELDGDERAYNREHAVGACGRKVACERLSLRPGPIVHDPERDRLLLFYTKLALDLEDGGERVVGSSIAVWRDDVTGEPARPVVAEGSSEPRLLFTTPGLRAADAALVEGGELYVFSCDGADHPCRLARAPLDLALRRGAWSFYADDDAWSPSPASAEVLFEGAGAMSVHWSARAGAYLAVYAEPGSASVVVRTAPRLEGPWSGAAEIHRVFQPIPATTIRSARLHPAFTSDDGAVDYLTYHHVEADALHLVEVRWE